MEYNINYELHTQRREKNLKKKKLNWLSYLIINF